MILEATDGFRAFIRSDLGTDSRFRSVPNLVYMRGMRARVWLAFPISRVGAKRESIFLYFWESE